MIIEVISHHEKQWEWGAKRRRVGPKWIREEVRELPEWIKRKLGARGVTEAKGKDFQDRSSVSESSNKMTSRTRSLVLARKKGPIMILERTKWYWQWV